ncbi:uncharacterized protein LOC133730879 [Rosa rugosa]|uniref:uncharacterized protein LOC133730879 n=1 Tax=Rosa rugosa TaxID=74645 RepID=UPI002B407AD0|nr:uncharacterized protein LOC133730879 [Rosa rugosa]
MPSMSSGASPGISVCPRAFMGGLDAALPSPPPAPKARSFASVLSNSNESSIPLSQLPAPVVRGDKIYVKINESLYQEQLKNFKTNLIGRLLLRKGSTPLKTTTLKGLLAALWRPSEPLRLVPLGKGYFDIHFATEEDLRRVWGGGTCTLPYGIFRLTQWKPDFVPGDTLPQTHAQVWVRLYGLSQDYWHQQHLMEISRGVGTPLHIDKATKERQFVYFARVLVDVDLAGELPSSLMVERETHCFPIEIVYENLCTHCGMVGHMADHCKHLKGSNMVPNAQGKKLVQKFDRVLRQEYRPKQASNKNIVSDHQNKTIPPAPPVHEVVPTSTEPIVPTETIQENIEFKPILAEEPEPIVHALVPYNSSGQDWNDLIEEDQIPTRSQNIFSEINQTPVTPPRGQVEMVAVNSLLKGDGNTGLEDMILVLSKGQKKKLRKKKRDGQQPEEGIVDRYPARNRGPPQKLNL